MRSWQYLLAALLLLCPAVSPAAATWSPPTDTGIYGVEWNASDPSPALTWIDENGDPISEPDFDNHVVWGNVKKVLLDDNNVVTRDINPRGDNLNMSGASGKVMTEIPAFYVKSENASTESFRYYRWWISPYNETGFTLHPAFVQRGGTARDNIYIGSYEATAKINASGTLVLDSRSGEQPWTGYNNNPRDGMFKIAFDAGTTAPAIGATVAGNTSGTTGQVVDLYVSSGSWANSNATGFLILKQTSGTFTNDEPLTVSGAQFATADTPNGNAGIVATINTFETAGEALGDGYGAMNVWTYSAIRMLHLIEYANWGSQETVGLGIVSKASGTGFAGEVTGFNSVDTNVNEYGTGTGTGSAGYTPASYRTMTDLWGNSWEWLTGYTSTNTEYQITHRNGTGSLSTHPLTAGSYESSATAPLGKDGSVYGYWTSLFHEDLLQYQFIADSVTGGSQSTYGTDYQYSHNPGTRVLLAGGAWSTGRGAGLGYLDAGNAASVSGRSLGARLEFTGAATLNGAAPAAQYTQNATAGNAPFAVAFTDTSTGTPGWWRWDFGDGNTSTDQSPTYTYTEPGTYNVTLTAYTIYGENTSTTETVTVEAPPAASFSTNTTAGNAPLTVAFTDASTGDITGWAWDFGDGNTSTDRNATHTYAAPGTYSVTLNASNAYGYNISAATAISVLDPPVANFSANATVIPTGSAVAFTDASTGNVTAWSWAFGDGNTSTDRNATHTYAAPGLYSVTLNASNPYGYNLSTRTDYIDVGNPPAADFTTNVTGGNAPQAVQFTDTTENTPTSWLWTFGDGSFSEDQHPVHTYDTPGTYTVSLTATNAYGEDTETKTDHITVLTAPGASFTQNVTAGNAPLTVAFTDASTGNVTGWAWDFGDSQTSTDRNATHTYAAPGTYSVTLNASNAYGYDLSAATAISVLDPPVANFSANATVIPTGSAVAFTDASTGNVTAWAWDFGDGNTSTDRNATHTYAAPGLYSVTLNASNAYGYNLSTRTDYIDVGNPPAAGFTTNATGGNAPLAVQFTDTSTGNVTGWAWDFGDGNTSTDRNATHTYAAPGTYTVTLNASNPYGYDLSTQTDLVTVLAPPAASFTQNVTEGNAPLAVQFTDASTGNVTAWAWDFGDGNTSTDRNATHTYAAPGLYNVTLNASNPYGYNISAATAISVLDPPVANFSANATVIPTGSAVAFTDASTGNVTSWAWDFGDGNTSTDRNATHTYAAPGLYSVTLNASNAYGYNLSTRTDYIDVGNPPAAGFTTNATGGNAPQAVQFTDTTEHTPTSWNWTFGDGSFSEDQRPVHVYAAPGTYTVSLTATNAYGEDTETKTDLITILTAPGASFTENVTAGNAPLTVAFTDASTGDITGWAWDFGDGNTSTDRNATHTYAAPGLYSVTLNASNAYGYNISAATAISVLDPPVANFTANATVIPVGGTVLFTDASTGDVTGWSWSFGDGATSSLKNPVHTYAAPGTYTVALTASNAYGSDTETKEAYIDAGLPPVASFTANVTGGNAPLTVQFTDASTGGITGWSWSFGDGATSSLKNPVHVYAAPGTYTVSLTATNAYGEDTETKTDHITVLTAPTAGFTADRTTSPAGTTVQFTDLSSGNITTWEWDFGDGYSAHIRHPAHTYTTTGIYTVALTVSNAYGEDTKTRIGYINIGSLPVAAFSASPTSGNAPLTVQFTDASTNTPTSWAWNFGDGNTSTDQSPSHTYVAAGTYTVSLTASNSYGGSAASKVIKVSETGSGITLRPKASSPIATLDEGPYNAFIASFGGNNQLNESTEGVDWLGIKDAAERPYTDLIGPFFYVIVFAIPFLMQWLRQGSMAVPAAIGIILGGIMLAKTPAEYHLAAIAFIALSILAVVWGVIKDRN